MPRRTGHGAGQQQQLGGELEDNFHFYSATEQKLTEEKSRAYAVAGAATRRACCISLITLLHTDENRRKRARNRLRFVLRFGDKMVDAFVRVLHLVHGTAVSDLQFLAACFFLTCSHAVVLLRAGESLHQLRGALPEAHPQAGRVDASRSKDAGRSQFRWAGPAGRFFMCIDGAVLPHNGVIVFVAGEKVFSEDRVLFKVCS